MERLVYLCSVLLIFLQIVIANNNNEKAINEYGKRAPASPLWFGPRLGRSKRNQHFDDLEELLSSDCDQIEEYIRLIPWTVVEKCAITEDKRDKPKSRQFSPRLGRESGEEFVGSSGDRWLEVMTQRSPPFAPRLGRRVLPFTPRLGREAFISL